MFVNKKKYIYRTQKWDYITKPNNWNKGIFALTRRPSIWLMAALSFSVHSATTLARISFMYNMNAFKGFFICGFFFSVTKKDDNKRKWDKFRWIGSSAPNGGGARGGSVEGSSQNDWSLVKSLITLCVVVIGCRFVWSWIVLCGTTGGFLITQATPVIDK